MILGLCPAICNDVYYWLGASLESTLYNHPTAAMPYQYKRKPKAVNHIKLVHQDTKQWLYWMVSNTTNLHTVKPVCNDHLYNKIYYLWFIQ